jgi:hypothetical protein
MGRSDPTQQNNGGMETDGLRRGPDLVTGTSTAFGPVPADRRTRVSSSRGITGWGLAGATRR